MKRLASARRGSSGVTLVEAVVVLAIVSISILTFAASLSNEEHLSNNYHTTQQMGLALDTFGESLKELVGISGSWPAVSCPAVAGPAANTTYTTASASNAKAYFQKLDALLPDALTKWTARGMTFTISSIQYWRGGPAIAAGGPNVTVAGDFGGSCSDPDAGAQELTLQVCAANSVSDGTRCMTGGSPAANAVRVGTIVIRRPLS